VAEKTATGDMAGLSRLLATIFWTFIGMAVTLLVVFLLIREPFLARMGVLAADRGEFGNAYVVFFIGLAVMPMLVFSMILTAIAIWVPISGKAGLLELGWCGAACMLPLLFLGRKVIREMARP
jgi:hypothetical protein